MIRRLAKKKRLREKRQINGFILFQKELKEAKERKLSFKVPIFIFWFVFSIFWDLDLGCNSKICRSLNFFIFYLFFDTKANFRHFQKRYSKIWQPSPSNLFLQKKIKNNFNWCFKSKKIRLAEETSSTFRKSRELSRLTRWKKLAESEREKFKKRAHLININEKIKAFKKFESNCTRNK